MSTDRDTTRIVRSWLEEGATELPDRVLDAVLDQLPTTPQRRATWWPARRLREMNNTAKLVLAAAAVLVVAFLGMRFMLPANVGAPAETPVPTATPSPIPLPADGALEPGTYVIDDPIITPRPFTLTVPAGWSTEEGFVYKGDSGRVTERDVFVASWIVTHVFEDACLRPGEDVDSLVEARTADQLVDALATQGGHETTGPDAVTLDGYSAQRLEFVVPDDFDIASCDDNFLRLWPDAGPDLSGGLPTFVGQTTRIFVVDADGEAVVIVASSMSGASSTDVAELEQVLASIRFAEAAP